MTTAVSPQNLHPRRGPDREDDDNRFYDGIAFASDSYVPWVVGRLRLGKADLSRMRSSGCPVLRSHQPDNVVGRVMKVEKRDGTWRSNWQLPKKPFNRDTFDQLDSSALRGVSVGGHLLMDTLVIDNPDETDWDDLLLTCDWVLVEQSLTSIPADVSSGVDRSLVAVLEREGAIFDTLISPEGIFTKNTTALQNHVGNLLREHNATVATLRREEEQHTMTTPAPAIIPPDVLQRAVADEIARTEALKSLSEIPAKLVELTAEVTAENERNMEYRNKLDKLQYQPNGQTLQLGNWSPGDAIINLGVVMRLTRQEDGILPPIDANTITTMEESIIERAELGKAGRDVLARLPWEALAERERQLQFQRAAMSDAAGARPVMIDVLGNGGLVLSSFSPILGRMDVRLGVEGAQKAPWATSQPTAVAGAEGADIAVTNLVLDNVEYLPKSLASAYEITTALRGVDDGTFQSIAMMAIRDVLLDQLTGQALVGGGANQISGLWGLTSVQETSYGAAQTDFTRQDALDFLDNVRLSRTDGGVYTGVLSTTLWKLCESVLRGGTASDMYLLENTGDGMGRMESEMMLHYADLSPTGITDSGLFFKGDKVLIWVWGGSMNLELIPQLARKDTYRMVLEANMVCQRPAQNVSRLRQT